MESGHLRNAVLIPLSQLAKQRDVQELPEMWLELFSGGRIIYLHCRSGGRCLRAAELLRKMGFDARPLKDGYADLVKDGFAAEE